MWAVTTTEEGMFAENYLDKEGWKGIPGTEAKAWSQGMREWYY